MNITTNYNTKLEWFTQSLQLDSTSVGTYLFTENISLNVKPAILQISGEMELVLQCGIQGSTSLQEAMDVASQTLQKLNVKPITDNDSVAYDGFLCSTIAQYYFFCSPDLPDGANTSFAMSAFQNLPVIGELPELLPLSPSGHIEGDEIQVNEFLSHIRPFIIKKDWITLVGGLAANEHTRNDIDIVVAEMSPEQLEKTARFRFLRGMPDYLAHRISFLPQNNIKGPITSYYPLGDLVFLPNEIFRRVAMSHTSDIQTTSLPLFTVNGKQATRLTGATGLLGKDATINEIKETPEDYLEKSVKITDTKALNDDHRLLHLWAVQKDRRPDGWTDDIIKDAHNKVVARLKELFAKDGKKYNHKSPMKFTNESLDITSQMDELSNWVSNTLKGKCTQEDDGIFVFPSWENAKYIFMAFPVILYNIGDAYSSVLACEGWILSKDYQLLADELALLSANETLDALQVHPFCDSDSGGLEHFLIPCQNGHRFYCSPDFPAGWNANHILPPSGQLNKVIEQLRAAPKNIEQQAKQTQREDRISISRMFYPMKPVRGASMGEPQTIENFMRLIEKEAYPCLTSKKFDGNTMIIFKLADEVRIYSDDGRNNTSKLPSLVSEIVKYSVTSFIALAELELWVDGVHYPRESVRQAMSSRPQYEPHLSANIFELVYVNGRDLHKYNAFKRHSVAKQVFAHLPPAEVAAGENRVALATQYPVRNRRELREQIDKLSNLSGSEGIVMKKGDYSLDGRATSKQAIKYHKSAVSNVMIMNSTLTKNGTYVYELGLLASGPSGSPSQPQQEIEGIGFVITVGKTFATKRKVDIGQVVKLSFETLNFITRNEESYKLTLWVPMLLNRTNEKLNSTGDAIVIARNAGVLQEKWVVGQEIYYDKAKVPKVKTKSEANKITIKQISEDVETFAASFIQRADDGKWLKKIQEKLGLEKSSLGGCDGLHLTIALYKQVSSLDVIEDVTKKLENIKPFDFVVDKIELFGEEQNTLVLSGTVPPAITKVVEKLRREDDTTWDFEPHITIGNMEGSEFGFDEIVDMIKPELPRRISMSQPVVMCESPTQEQIGKDPYLEYPEHGKQLKVMRHLHGRGKSVSDRTPIVIRKNENIEVIPIKDLFSYSEREKEQIMEKEVEGIETWTKSGWSKISYAMRHKQDAPIRRVLTCEGLIDVTDDHSLFRNNTLFNEGAPVKTSDLNIGDDIELIELPKLEGETDVDKNLAWLYGFYLAEGNTHGRRSGIEITSTEWKIIPKCVFSWNKESQEAFLKGFFDGDGIDINYEKGRIEWASASQIVAQGILLLTQRVFPFPFFRIKYQDSVIRISLANEEREERNVIKSLETARMHSRYGIDNPNFKTGEYASKFLPYSLKDVWHYSKNRWVYDIETENHDFLAGVGKIRAHNSVHFDVRRQFDNDWLVGWTENVQIEGAVDFDVDTLEEAHKVFDGYSVDDGNDYLKPLGSPSKLVAEVLEKQVHDEKAKEPIEWMSYVGVKPPGEVGSTKEHEGTLLIIDEGTTEWGASKPAYHEYFDSDGKIFNGRYIVRLLRDAWNLTPEKMVWMAWYADDPTPYVLSKRAVKLGWMPPDGQSALPKIIRDVIPNEYYYWKETGDKAKRIRDKLVNDNIVSQGFRFNQKGEVIPNKISVVEGEVNLYRVAKRVSVSSKVQYALMIQANGKFYSYLFEQDPRKNTPLEFQFGDAGEIDIFSHDGVVPIGFAANRSDEDFTQEILEKGYVSTIVNLPSLQSFNFNSPGDDDNWQRSFSLLQAETGDGAMIIDVAGDKYKPMKPSVRYELEEPSLKSMQEIWNQWAKEHANPMIMQEKINGIRLIATFKNGDLQKLENDDGDDVLADFLQGIQVERIDTIKNGDYVLDFEMMSDGRLYLLTVMQFNGVDVRMAHEIDRMKLVRQLLKGSSLKLPSTVLIKNAQEFYKTFELFFDKIIEGLMLKDGTSVYDRMETNQWAKILKVSFAEAMVEEKQELSDGRFVYVIKVNDTLLQTQATGINVNIGEKLQVTIPADSSPRVVKAIELSV